MIYKTRIIVVSIFACLLGEVQCSDHKPNNGTTSELHVPGDIIGYLDEKEKNAPKPNIYGDTTQMDNGTEITNRDKIHSIMSDFMGCGIQTLAKHDLLQETQIID